MRVAAAKYPVGEPADFQAFADKQSRLLREAKQQGAELALLPEYLSLELAAGFPADVRGDLSRSLAALQPLHPAWCELYADLARELRDRGRRGDDGGRRGRRPTVRPRRRPRAVGAAGDARR